jgi:hypothetical protein
MKLLSYIPPFIKDAAKAVKRISQKEFTAVADTTLTKLLGIATLFVTMYALRREGDEDVLHLRWAHREEVAVCTPLWKPFNKCPSGGAAVRTAFGCLG